LAVVGGGSAAVAGVVAGDGDGDEAGFEDGGVTPSAFRIEQPHSTMGMPIQGRTRGTLPFVRAVVKYLAHTASRATRAS
jgi:hypothetical protein